MGRRTEALYSKVTDFGSSSDVELAFLPPTAAARTKKQPYDDTVTLLHGVDTAYNPPQGGGLR